MDMDGQEVRNIGEYGCSGQFLKKIDLEVSNIGEYGCSKHKDYAKGEIPPHELQS